MHYKANICFKSIVEKVRISRYLAHEGSWDTVSTGYLVRKTSRNCRNVMYVLVVILIKIVVSS